MHGPLLELAEGGFGDVASYPTPVRLIADVSAVAIQAIPASDKDAFANYGFGPGLRLQALEVRNGTALGPESSRYESHSRLNVLTLEKEVELPFGVTTRHPKLSGEAARVRATIRRVFLAEDPTPELELSVDCHAPASEFWPIVHSHAIFGPEGHIFSLAREGFPLLERECRVLDTDFWDAFQNAFAVTDAALSSRVDLEESPIASSGALARRIAEFGQLIKRFLGA